LLRDAESGNPAIVRQMCREASRAGKGFVEHDAAKALGREDAAEEEPAMKKKRRIVREELYHLLVSFGKMANKYFFLKWLKENGERASWEARR